MPGGTGFSLLPLAIFMTLAFLTLDIHAGLHQPQSVYLTFLCHLFLVYLTGSHSLSFHCWIQGVWFYWFEGVLREHEPSVAQGGVTKYYIGVSNLWLRSDFGR